MVRADSVTSVTYLRDVGQGVRTIWKATPTSKVSARSWAKLSATAYQSTTTTTSQSTLPYVLPRANYSYYNVIDRWGGRFSLDTGVINVLRETGTNTARLNADLNCSASSTIRSAAFWNFRANDTTPIIRPFR